MPDFSLLFYFKTQIQLNNRQTKLFKRLNQLIKNTININNENNSYWRTRNDWQCCCQPF